MIKLKKTINLLPLFIICLVSALLIFPTINNNIYDHNMIHYFNADEGGLMDLLWMNYSGEKMESMQFDVDYGLELVYLSKFLRVVMSPFIEFTPGTLMYVVRWVHSLAWICSIIGLWRLVGNHFGRGWQQVSAVSLLAVRPAFPYILNSSKPEPLVLLLMIVGLDYAFRLIDKPSKKHLIISVCSMSIAFLIKYTGLFLLPAIIAAMYFSKRYNARKTNSEKNIFAFPEIKKPYLLPLMMGIIIILLPLIVILFYVRKSTGLTFYEELGLWGTAMEKRLILDIWMVGVFSIMASFAIRILNKHNNAYLRIIMKTFNELNSYAFIVFVVFSIATLIFGIKWFINPKHFILVYAQLGTAATSPISVLEPKGLLHALLQNIAEKIHDFDAILFFLFIIYLFIEVYKRHINLNDELFRLIMFKRMVLLIFLVAPAAYMFTLLRMAQHHMLPFFVAMVILVIQGIHMLMSSYHEKKLV